MAIQKVLAAIDLSEASRTPLRYAAALASRVGASLTALYVQPRAAHYQPFPTFPPEPLHDPTQRSATEQEVAKFVEASSAQATAQIVVRDGDPADEILAGADAIAADLLVLGTHGRRGFERWSLGSVADRVARRSPRPLLAVPPHSSHAAMKRVLCAVDLADGSGAVLEFAVQLSQRLGARLQVLYVAEASHWYDPWPVSGVDQGTVRKAVAEVAEQRLNELVASHVPATMAVEKTVTFGRAQQEIERIASEEGELAVLGVTSKSGIDRLFFGSTAQHVLRSAVCPVLLVRPPAAG